MSELILKGDTVENFGEYMPVPYIKQLRLSEHESTISECATRVDPTLNVFLLAPEEADEETLINRLAQYTFNVAIISAPAGDQDLADILSGKHSIVDATDQTSSADPTIDTLPLDMMDFTTEDGALTIDTLAPFTMLDFTTEDGALSPAYEVLYDENNNRVLKFTYTTTALSDEDSLRLLSPCVTDEGYDHYFFAWSTMEDFEESHWDTSDTEPRPVSWDNLATSETSDVAYEPIALDGAIYAGSQIIYVDLDGGPYGATPLQSIAGLYYQPDKLTHTDIVDSFQQLIDDYTAMAETDTALQDAIDNISLILETDGTSADLLPKLNEYRKSFPSKTSATTVGKLYGKFRKKIVAADKVVALGIQLFKETVTSPKVVDVRVSEFEFYTPPTYPDDLFPGQYALTPDDPCYANGATFSCDEGECDFVYLGNATGYPTTGTTRLTRVAWPALSSDTSAGSVMVPSSTSEGIVNDGAFGANYGVFFFDYDKAIYYKSYIGQFMDIERVIAMFGIEVVNAAFNLRGVTIERFRGTHQRMKMYQNYEQENNAPTPGPWGVEYTIYNDSGAEGQEPGMIMREALTVNDVDNHSFVLLRNFDFASDKKIDDYGTGYIGQPAMRFMAFQFQDLMGYHEQLTAVFDESDAERRQTYKFTVHIEDVTHLLLEGVLTVYSQYGAEAAEAYKEAAAEPCAYSATTGEFNDYFINDQLSLYEDSPQDAPWIKAPTLYIYMQDIFYNTYGGDEEAMKEAIASLSYSISPDTGTKDEVDTFFDNYDALTQAWSTDDIDYIVDEDGLVTIDNPNFELEFTCQYDLDVYPILSISDYCSLSSGLDTQCPGWELTTAGESNWAETMPPTVSTS